MAIHGRAYITIGGRRYNTKEGATIKLGGEAGSPVVGDSGFAGMQYQHEAGQVDCTFIASDDVSITDIQKIKNVNMTFDSDNGKSYVSSNASNGPVPELSKDGIKATFYGSFKEV
ncbi:MAG: phage tail tube protein [Methylotenera sp.]|nr:phage tail tube protein [Methylotenera sp.]